MLLYNWMFILLSSKKLTKPKMKGNVQIITALVLILFAVSGTLFEKTVDPAFCEPSVSCRYCCCDNADEKRWAHQEQKTGRHNQPPAFSSSSIP